jgi:hypothetical protein
VHASAQELEVVRGDESCTERDERHDPEGRLERHSDPDRARDRDGPDGETDEHGGWDPRPEGPAMELVERVRPDAHREREREHGEAEPPPRDARREAAADDDVGEVPRRVREMEERHVVPPAAGSERVERRPARL